MERGLPRACSNAVRCALFVPAGYGDGRFALPSSGGGAHGYGLARRIGIRFRHPFSCIDHRLAMISLGLWGILGRHLLMPCPWSFRDDGRGAILEFRGAACLRLSLGSRCCRSAGRLHRIVARAPVGLRNHCRGSRYSLRALQGTASGATPHYCAGFCSATSLCTCAGICLVS